MIPHWLWLCNHKMYSTAGFEKKSQIKSCNTLLKPKRHQLRCHGFVVRTLLLRMNKNVVDFRVMRRLCHRLWNLQAKLTKREPHSWDPQRTTWSRLVTFDFNSVYASFVMHADRDDTCTLNSMEGMVIRVLVFVWLNRAQLRLLQQRLVSSLCWLVLCKDFFQYLASWYLCLILVSCSYNSDIWLDYPKLMALVHFRTGCPKFN